jgi:hypothetical protein
MTTRFRILLAAALLLPVAAAWADVLCALGSATAVNAYKPASDQRPSADTMQIVRRVDAALAPFCQPKCPQAAMLRNDTAPNLMLTADQNGARLVYAPQFFAAAYAKFGEPALIALIAHVYGHAIDEVTRPVWLPASWNLELRADGWAGCVLAKSNLPAASLSSALAALAMYPPPAQTAWAPRAAALRLGFAHCGGATSQFDAASNTANRAK